MGRFRYTETAVGQGSVLFVAAGLLGLLNAALPGAGGTTAIRLISAGSILAGLAISRLPWNRWPASATLGLVPVALGLIVAARWFGPGVVGTTYALWFVVVFAWIGSWHPSATAMFLAPGAAIAYVIPFLPNSPAASTESLPTVVIAIPIALVVSQVVSTKSMAMRRAHGALEEAAILLERANVTDDLTGLGNRRRANTLLDVMAPGDAIALLDLDHFKVVNDTRGHAAGDRVLMHFGRYLRAAVRDADCVARFGGEEFLLLLPGAGDEAGIIVERLVDGWRRCGEGVTLSAGAAVHALGAEPDETLKRADALLYQAKAAGRDRVVAELIGWDSAMRTLVKPIVDYDLPDDAGQIRSDLDQDSVA